LSGKHGFADVLRGEAIRQKGFSGKRFSAIHPAVGDCQLAKSSEGVVSED
jgi:hypothetical protein